MSSDTMPTELRRELEIERDQLQRQLEEMGFGDLGTGLSYDTNFADTSQVMAERGEAAALAASLQETLAEVLHALDKFDRGTFGWCERCGSQIPLMRLEALPIGRYCISCATSR